MENAWKRWVVAALGLLPLAATGVLLVFLPDTIALHFSANGTADGWGSKYLLLILPLITPALLAGTSALIMKFGKSPKANFYVLLGLGIVLDAMTGVTLALAYLGSDSPAGGFDSMKIVTVAIGFAEVVIGNILPKVNRNFILGIRVSWTLENEVVWKKTHRFGGVVFVILGAASMLVAALPISGFWALTGSVGGMVAISLPVILVYAYRCYRKETEKDGDKD